MLCVCGLHERDLDAALPPIIARELRLIIPLCIKRRATNFLCHKSQLKIALRLIATKVNEESHKDEQKLKFEIFLNEKNEKNLNNK